MRGRHGQGKALLRLLGTAIHGLRKLKLFAPTTGALLGAIVSGVPGAIVGAGLAAAITKSLADDWANVRNRPLRIKE